MVHDGFLSGYGLRFRRYFDVLARQPDDDPWHDHCFFAIIVRTNLLSKQPEAVVEEAKHVYKGDRIRYENC